MVVVEFTMITTSAIAIEATVALLEAAIVDFAAAMESASAGTMEAAAAMRDSAATVESATTVEASAATVESATTVVATLSLNRCRTEGQGGKQNSR